MCVASPPSGKFWGGKGGGTASRGINCVLGCKKVMPFVKAGHLYWELNRFDFEQGELFAVIATIVRLCTSVSLYKTAQAAQSTLGASLGGLSLNRGRVAWIVLNSFSLANLPPRFYRLNLNEREKKFASNGDNLRSSIKHFFFFLNKRCMQLEWRRCEFNALLIRLVGGSMKEIYNETECN